jgi:RNA polymerase sigma-70 factor (ECF subfamily)
VSGPSNKELAETPRDGEETVAIEEHLIRRAQQGDRQAMRQLLGLHSDVLYGRVILPRVGEVATAEDLLKQTMVTIIEKLASFRWQGRSSYHWMRQIAVNKVIDHHRASARGRRLAERLAHEEEVFAQGGGTPGPEAALIAQEEQALNRQRIEQTLAQINPRYRRAIELRLIEELPREGCAERLEVTVATFDVIFFRAIQAFRKAFSE